ncbi:sulfite exporter TauE/SafE family protein [Mucilaginibacter sp. Bleaf8]|uniref:sulfite exporter TauE/SafE family protein n=1 Tax=Mucilaginibacter sp. Bleaf8 TaxID=2834430 RepID=UPI001BD06764|nr:sulfite exporter TauE/SafE family protein [Mucilaginibacter sp. Bleaf8]MBS7563324.1 sulfite exporter TauE/SafE family protein [Mucilaginibacter sp. Bleaf8]
MSNNEIAFFIGLFGSIHCVGMCGPLAFAVPVAGGGKWMLVWDKLVYNFGRTISYTLLGLLTGLIGKQLWLSGLQQWVSILSGVFILLAAATRIFKLSVTKGQLAAKLLAPFNRLLGYALTRHAGHLAIGMLNGFLPCGFVYLALIGAVNTSTVLGSAQYMFWFGVGTLPLMLAATISSGFAGPVMRRKFNNIVPYFMICLGLWFVLRGLSLDIPYLSPSQNMVNGVCK